MPKRLPSKWLLIIIINLTVLLLGVVLEPMIRQSVVTWVCVGKLADWQVFNQRFKAAFPLINPPPLRQDTFFAGDRIMQLSVLRVPSTSISSDSIILQRSVLVPKASILDPRQNIEADATDLHIIKIEDLKLPNKALRFAGLNIDHPKYPLVDNLVLSPPSNEVFPESWQKNLRVPQKPSTVYLAFVGDLMCGIGLEELFEQGESGLAEVFGDTLPILQGVDFLSGNLEGAVSVRGTAVPKSYNFRYRPSIIPALKNAGFDHVMLSNNHAWDFGEIAFLDTLLNLEQHSLIYTGGGNNLANALVSRHVDIGPQKLLLNSFGAYPNESKGFSGLAQAAATKTKPGILWNQGETLQALYSEFQHWRSTNSHGIGIIHCHGGYEYQAIPDQNSQSLYKQIADQGYSLIVASHPHVLQGFEVHKQSLIFYSLGNFLFPGMTYEPSKETVIAIVGTYNGQIIYFEPQGVRIDRTKVRLDKSGQVLSRWYKLSEALQ